VRQRPLYSYRHFIFAIASIALLALFACGPKVMVPPNVDLAVFRNVGLVGFTSNAEGNLADYATQKFLEIVTASQPDARIIELGAAEEVLAKVGAEDVDLTAIEDIAMEYGVASIIAGDLDVSDVKPHVSLSIDLARLGVEADIEATLRARLIDTSDGATVWTCSAKKRKKVADVDILSGGGFAFSAEDPAKAYGPLVDGLVDEVTYDLRVRYERQ